MRSRSFWRDADGAVAIIAAGSLFAMVGMGALVVDGSNLYLVQNELQTMADEAALAAARHGATDTDRARAAARRLLERYAEPDAAEARVTTDQLEFGAWDAARRTFQPGAGQPDAVAVTTRRAVTTFFAGLIGVRSVTLEAAAIARFGSAARTCLLTLDPSANRSARLDSNARITATGCNVHVNSSAARAIDLRSNARVTAAEINVVGGFGGAANRYTPRPTTGSAALDDPLAQRAAPTVGACNHNNREIKDITTVIAPGVYCGGLTIDGNARVTLQPGIYVMKDGKFRIDSNSRVTGTGVGFYLTGNNATLELNSNSVVDLRAPTSGALAGIVFFEDRTAPLLRTHRLDSNSIGRLEGAIYLSRGRLAMDSNSTIAASSAYTDIIVRQLDMNSNSHLVLNASYADSDVPRAIQASPPLLVN